MEKKKSGFSASGRLRVLVTVLVVLSCLLLADGLRSRGIFKYRGISKCLLCRTLHANKEGLPPSTSVTAIQPNFHVVAPGVWRSALPDPESLRLMRTYGLKTIVNLRLDAEGELWESKLAAELGVQYFHFPISADTIVPAKTVDAILSVLSDPQRQPVLIHCVGGKDRTGMIIAAYQLAHTKWSFPDIYQEMKMYGFDVIHFQMLTTLRLWSGAHGFLEAAQQIALVEKNLAQQRNRGFNP